MKRLALILAVVFTTLALQSCRQSDDILSPEEVATLQRVQDSTSIIMQQNNADALDTDQNNSTASIVDGEILPPPRK